MINKLSDKDKKDWERFVKGDEKVENKDKAYLNDNKQFLEKTIDLHGYTLEEANKKIFEYIENCYLNNIKKINVITGKGLRSKNYKDPYVSSTSNILKNSIPEYILSDSDLLDIVDKISKAEIKDGGDGAIYVYLKKL